MKKRVNIVYLFILMIGCLFLIAIKNVKVSAANFNYESGTIEEKYGESLVVLSFSYDYETKFSEQEGYYNGVEIIDNGNSLKDKWFYSAKNMTITINHYDEKLSKHDDDKTIIYKYNTSTRNFESMFIYENEPASHVLNEEGIYKIEYTFYADKLLGEDINVHYEHYVYITAKTNEIKIKEAPVYDESSAYVRFFTYITMSDAYDIRFHEYYYAFGESKTDQSQLNFRPCIVFLASEKNKIKVIKSIENRLVSVKIDAEDVTANGEKKYLFIKVRKKIDENNYVEEIVSTSKSYNLFDKLEAYVDVLDNEGNVVNEHVSYKSGDVVNFQVTFSAPVTFSDFKYSVNGTDFYKIDAITEETKVINFSYEVLNTNYVKSNLFFQNNVGGEFGVKYKEYEVSATVVVRANFEIDSLAPGISISDDMVEGEMRREYNVVININEDNLAKVSYYFSTCSISQDNKCMDEYNENNENIYHFPDSIIESYNNGDSALLLFNKDIMGSHNGENFVLFIRAEDVAGNVSLFNKYGYLVDNVIVPEGDETTLFVEKDIKDGEVTIGKSLNILVNDEYKVNNVFYQVFGGERVACSVVEDSNVEEGKTLYKCLEITGYSFSSNVVVTLEDEYINRESYTKFFKYSDLVSGEVEVGGYKFNVYNDKLYDMETTSIGNIVYGENNVEFSLELLNQIGTSLKLSSIPGLTDLNMSLIFLNEEEMITLSMLENERIVVPNLTDIINKIKHLQGYSACSIKGNKCDIDVYLKYDYLVVNIPQTRLVKIKFIDNSLKFDIIDFKDVVDVDVNGDYSPLQYTVVDGLNMQVDMANIEKTKIITYIDGGEEKIVDSIDTTKLGVYKIEERVAVGQQSSFSLSYQINVVDKIAPTIKLKVESELKINIGEKLDNLLDAVEVSDNYDKEVTIKYEWDKKFDNKTEGTYVLSYWAEDSSGNKSEIITRTIIVEKSSVITYVIIGVIVLGVILLIVGVSVNESKKQRRS